MFALAFSAYFGADRPFYQLAHNLVMAWPGLGVLRRYGTVAATHENAVRALDAGAAVLVYPGGDYETHRPSWKSARVDFNRRSGFIALALDRGLPIVPVVSIGGQETALFLSRGQRLAHALRLDRSLRLHVLPISLAVAVGVERQ
ncbi:MAG: 1-acyl-sn-glycerol-3-phosphate acyltransferase [Solirubrobacteraceae bacterium]